MSASKAKALAENRRIREAEEIARGADDYNSQSAMQIIARGGIGCAGFVFGPIVYEPIDSETSRYYFNCGYLKEPEKAVRLDTLNIDMPDTTDTQRGLVRSELIAKVILITTANVHASATELGMTQIMESLWPCEQTTSMREKVQAAVMSKAI